MFVSENFQTESLKVQISSFEQNETLKKNENTNISQSKSICTTEKAKLSQDDSNYITFLCFC